MAEVKNNHKQVKQTTQKKNFYLIVYNYINSGKSIQDVIFDYGVTKQKLQYYINRLKEGKVIKKVGYATWVVINKLDPKKVKTKVKQSTHDTITKTKILSDEIRAHGFMYKLKLPKIPNWDKRTDYMDKNDIKYDPIHSKGNKIIVNGKIVHLFSNSIIVYDKYSYISMLAKEAKSLAIYKFECILKRIESMFKVSLRINRGYRFKVSKEHYGLIKNSLAKQYNDNGDKLSVYNSDGLWLVIDNSFNMHELEVQKNRSINQDQAVNDTNNVQSFFNSLKSNPGFTPDVVLNTFSQVLQAQTMITNNQNLFSENIETHITAIQKLGSAVEELTKLVKKRNL